MNLTVYYNKRKKKFTVNYLTMAVIATDVEYFSGKRVDRHGTDVVFRVLRSRGGGKSDIMLC